MFIILLELLSTATPFSCSWHISILGRSFIYVLCFGSEWYTHIPLLTVTLLCFSIKYCTFNISMGYYALTSLCWWMHHFALKLMICICYDTEYCFFLNLSIAHELSSSQWPFWLEFKIHLLPADHTVSNVAKTKSHMSLKCKHLQKHRLLLLHTRLHNQTIKYLSIYLLINLLRSTINAFILQACINLL